jgi:hypothetical protein
VLIYQEGGEAQEYLRDQKRGIVHDIIAVLALLGM